MGGKDRKELTTGPRVGRMGSGAHTAGADGDPKDRGEIQDGYGGEAIMCARSSMY